MTLLEMLGLILIGPLKILFEVVFSVAYRILDNPGLTIIVLSLAMNIMVLPLYRRADAIQIEARDTENMLKDVVAHIKKTFSGDEQMMILQTYYRQNNYNPLSVLSGSISLMLEIPFFMAAYQFLSGVEVFRGMSFGPIADLSAPDGMLQLGEYTINLLPGLMTLVNVISSSIYLKGFPLKTKIQLYGMAFFFLIFLYNAPAALVFYWTLNNAFSLFKNLFNRMRHSDKILKVLLSLAGMSLLGVGATMDNRAHAMLVAGIGVATQLPWLIPVMKKVAPSGKKQAEIAKADGKLFVIGAAFMAVLVGLMIPSTYVSASPQEYIDTVYFYNPVWYVVYSLCLSVGTFCVWMGVFYWLAKPSGKVFFSRLVWVICGIMLVDYMFFGTNLGVLTPDLRYTDGFAFSRREQQVNLAVIALLIVPLYLVVRKYPSKVFAALLGGSIALTAISGIQINLILKTVEATQSGIQESAGDMPSFTLNKNGKNVVVIMLDRAIGPFIPYIMHENPTLHNQFDGFTYYENTLSYGGYTNFATPALYGGYEYTPVNLNLRSDERLAVKHNEALKVVPTIFAENDYDVTLIDPSYAGYQWTPDISIYNDIPGVKAYLAEGKFEDTQDKINIIATRKRNFFMFGVMKTLPVSIQPAVYNGGRYRAINTGNDTSGVSPSFMKAYNVLRNMQTMTRITDDASNTYMFLRSNATHEAVVLQEPNFEPSTFVDNSAYYPEERRTISKGIGGYWLGGDYTISHYHVNMASLMQLGNWFDYLRSNDVYDNTRIIIVSDHGRNLGVFDSDEILMHNIEFYQPLLMVKDFGAEAYETSDAFMTNADVPALSMEGLIESPVNPFTNKRISLDQKTEMDKHYVIASSAWDIKFNNGYQFEESEWAMVSGDVSDKENWTFFTEESVLPPDLQN